MYHAFGIREQECSGVRYEEKGIVLKLQTRQDKLCCPLCKQQQIIRSGSHIRRIRSIPVGSKPVILEMKVQLPRDRDTKRSLLIWIRDVSFILEM
ncbi:MAG: transposase family protein [Tannerella sp.]|jgi:transposase|nr:transposase family protein [Tannerella sp.]